MLNWTCCVSFVSGVYCLWPIWNRPQKVWSGIKVQPLSLWLASQQQSPLNVQLKLPDWHSGLKPSPRYEIRFDCAAFGETCVSTLPEGAVTYSTWCLSRCGPEPVDVGTKNGCVCGPSGVSSLLPPTFHLLATNRFSKSLLFWPIPDWHWHLRNTKMEAGGIDRVGYGTSA